MAILGGKGSPQSERTPDWAALRERALGPRHPEFAASVARYAMRLLNLDSGRADEARALLEPQAELWPDRLDLHEALLKVYDKLGKREEAKAQRAVVEAIQARAEEEDAPDDDDDSSSN